MAWTDRWLFENKMTIIGISDLLGIPYGNLWMILHRKTWNHI